MCHQRRQGAVTQQQLSEGLYRRILCLYIGTRLRVPAASSFEGHEPLPDLGCHVFFPFAVGTDVRFCLTCADAAEMSIKASNFYISLMKKT